jgi:CRP-like cAMP-binding protein
LCELYVRLNAVGLASNFTFALPLTQQALAEATGLSAVHVNRTLSQLKRDRLVTMTSREVQLHKWVTLCEVADFDPAYLYSRAPANPRP